MSDKAKDISGMSNLHKNKNFRDDISINLITWEATANLCGLQGVTTWVLATHKNGLSTWDLKVLQYGDPSVSRVLQPDYF